MKLIATADWHVHNFQDYSTTKMVAWDRTGLRFKESEGNPEAREMNSRLLGILSAICDMRDYAKENQITDILFAGDLFHKRKTIDITVFNAIYKVLDSFSTLGITLHAIAGNHDQTDSSVNPESALHGLQELIHVIEKPTYFMIEGQEIVAIPYSKDKKFVLDSIMKLKSKCKDPNSAILMCHLGIDGGTVGSGMRIMSDDFTVNELKYNKWKAVVCGHYHQPQFVCGTYNTIYTGSITQNNFGDERPGYNGFFVLDTSRRWDIRFIQLVAPRFVTVKSTEELESLSPEFIKSNYIRVVSQADKAGDIQEKLTEILGDDTSSVKLELEKSYNTEQRSDVSVTQSPEEVVKTYASERWEDKERLEAVTTVGLEIMQEALTT